MRDRIVHMQQIEVLILRHLRHPRGQRQRIGRVLKQRIWRDLDLVIVDTRQSGVEPDRIRVRDEVNFVAALRELEPKFRRDDAAAAVGGITGDADLHWMLMLPTPICPLRFCAGFWFIAAAEPKPVIQNRRIANYRAIPRLIACERFRLARPMNAVAGARGDERALLGRAAPRVEHPVRIVRLPYCRLAQSVLIRRAAAGVWNRQHRAGA